MLSMQCLRLASIYLLLKPPFCQSWYFTKCRGSRKPIFSAKLTSYSSSIFLQCARRSTARYLMNKENSGYDWQYFKNFFPQQKSSQVSLEGFLFQECSSSRVIDGLARQVNWLGAPWNNSYSPKKLPVKSTEMLNLSNMSLMTTLPFCTKAMSVMY